MTSKVRKRTSRDTKYENMCVECIGSYICVFEKIGSYICVLSVSDHIYVTFPAYDVYSLRLRLREYRYKPGMSHIYVC